MTAKQKPVTPDNIRSAVLNHLDSDADFNALDFETIANGLDSKIDDIKSIYPNKTDIYIDILKSIDAEIKADYTTSLLNEPPKDRLFEVLMLRFDILNQHRRAYKTLFFETFKSPDLFRSALPQFHRSIEVMLRLADMNGRDGGGFAPVRVGAVALAYLNTVRVWMNDDSEDMAATMAELDSSLSKLDMIYGKIPDALKRFI